MKMQRFSRTAVVLAACVILSLPAYAQKPTRVGSTTADFLEIGYGAAGIAMGDAYVSLVNDASAVYWNPAGLAQMERTEVMFVTQPWIVGMTATFASFGIVVPDVGTIGGGLILMNYGDMEVTTVAMQEGTGEHFSPKDIAVSLSFARNLVDWFSFGVTAKMINSSIWHESATAVAFDLGVIIKTGFFSPEGGNKHGLDIGMSISNYGTPLRYDGLDLLVPIDPAPNEAGNYSNAPGRYATQDWELPLIFRMGASFTPLLIEGHEIIVSVDALHPNNNSESVNIGAQYSLTLKDLGKVSLRTGYKALGMPESQYSMTYGIGVQTDLFGDHDLKVDYAYRAMGILGNVQSLGVSLLF
jgi:hypothetical protein